ncbi:hypothetical protein BST61_g3566 [Cercospora zeina]
MGLRQRQIPRETLTMADIVSKLEPLLQIQPNKVLVIMLCGPPGSGKTTLSQEIVAQNPILWEHVSQERVIAPYRGQFDSAYREPTPNEEHHRVRLRARAGIRLRLLAWLDRLQPWRGLILDDRFSRKAERDEFRAVIEEAGAEVRLVFLDFDKDVLWDRIKGRTELAAKERLPGWIMDRAMFEESWKAFKRPRDEGEHTISGR